MHALLVCEDTDESAILTLVLQRSGVTLGLVEDLRRALERWSEQPADLVLLAAEDGPMIEQIRSVRRATEAPLVVIAPPRDEDTLCRAYEAGADWVITRPYSTRLLIQQIRAILRRGQGVPLLSLPSLTVGELTLDPSLRTVAVEDRSPRRLTHLEFRLLYTLMIHRGQTLSPATLVERVWGYQGEGSLELVRGLISRLRAKIEADPKRPEYVLTVPGLGYCFRNPHD